MIALLARIWRGAGGAGAFLVLALLLSTPAYAGNNAAFSSQSVPSTMVAGGGYTVSVSMTNTGTTTWSSGTSHLLGSQNPQDNVVWGGGRAALSAPVAPGQTATIAFHVTAPSTPGTYNFQWKMLQEYLEWFGATSPNVAVVVNALSPVNGAAVTAFSAPATMTKGQTYPVAVTMQNTGNTTWPAGGAYLLGSKNPNDNLTWGLKRVALASSVAPGQQATFSFQVVAPTQGTYSMQWGMVQEYVQWFGATASANVTVGAGTSDTVTYIHTDGLGSPVARSDASGKVISRTRYEPYGLTAAGDVPSIGFTGHVNDADTGLVYMQQRYYDPVAGRFLSIDPVTTDANTGGSFNRYDYAGNNPFKYIDPDGRVIVDVAFVAADIYAIATEGATTTNLIVLGLDAASTAGFGFGAGQIYRVGHAASEVYKGSKLARNMAEAGNAVTKGEQEAHHIVAKGAEKADPARKILANHGIDIHGAENGAAMSKAPHKNVHTKSYYDTVNATITEAAKNGKESVVDALDKIRKILEKNERIERR